MKLRYTLNDPFPVEADFTVLDPLSGRDLLVHNGYVTVPDDAELTLMLLQARGFVAVDPATEPLEPQEGRPRLLRSGALRGETAETDVSPDEHEE